MKESVKESVVGFKQGPDTESDLCFRRLLPGGWTRGGWGWDGRKAD